MVSSGVVALVLAALAQAVYSAPSCGCGPVFAPAYPIAACAAPVVPALEEGCCPGPVVEQKSVIAKTFNVPYSYSQPTFSKQCYQRPAGVDTKVFPSAFESAPVCETQETVVKVPTTDVQVQEQPLVRKTCTTSEYVIQIPIVETTCTSAPLCKKTVRTQDNVLTTVSKKTSCAKQVCTQNKVVEQPFTETVCQNYQGSVTKAGSQTVVKPEVVKSCVQLPPRKCLKPATGPGTYVDYGNGPVAYNGYFPGAYGGVTEVFSGPYGGVAEVVSGPYGGVAEVVSGPYGAVGDFVYPGPFAAPYGGVTEAFIGPNYGPGVYGYGVGETIVGPAYGSYGVGETIVGPGVYGYGVGETIVGPGVYGYGVGETIVGPGAYGYGVGETIVGPAYGSYGVGEAVYGVPFGGFSAPAYVEAVGPVYGAEVFPTSYYNPGPVCSCAL